MVVFAQGGLHVFLQMLKLVFDGITLLVQLVVRLTYLAHLFLKLLL